MLTTVGSLGSKTEDSCSFVVFVLFYHNALVIIPEVSFIFLYIVRYGVNFGKWLYSNRSQFVSGACRKPASNLKPCPKKCPSQKRPVCGTDGKTYINGCQLATAKCSLPKNKRSSLRVAYVGSCEVPATPKPCPRWEECKVVLRPVCGSDGKTYPDICRLRVAMCHARRNGHQAITLKYRTACKKRKGRKEKRQKKGKNDKKNKSGRKGRRE